MKDDSMLVVGVVLVFLSGMLFGSTIGAAVVEKEVKKACENYGKYMLEDKVYFCFPEGGK
jgi:hypothetical protein